jgi:hypothetical protein
MIENAKTLPWAHLPYFRPVSDSIPVETTELMEFGNGLGPFLAREMTELPANWGRGPGQAILRPIRRGATQTFLGLTICPPAAIQFAEPVPKKEILIR